MKRKDEVESGSGSGSGSDEWWMRVVVAVLGKVCLVVCVSLVCIGP
jgi:hypothetical protein